MNHAVLETKQRDILFTVIHGLYRNRDRLFQQHRADDPLCANQTCKNSGLAQTIEHIFCTCFRVRTAWLWLRHKLIELLSDQGPVPALSNFELIMLMYPKCRQEAEATFLLGTYMELVDNEVTSRQKELLVGTLRGVLGAKLRHMASRAVPEIYLPLNWL